MNNKELFYFVGKCLMLDEDPGLRKEIFQKIEADEIDWVGFTKICDIHLILPVIYLKFKSQGLMSYLPEGLVLELSRVYKANVLRNSEILKQITEITRVLNENEIFPLFLKGAGNLLDGVYGDLGERILGDIDFLVPEKDWLKSVKVLEKDGYYTRTLYPESYDFIGAKHYPPLVKEGAAAYLEIHRSLTNGSKKRFNNALIEQAKTPVSNLNGCFVLSDEHKVMYNFIHGQLQHQGHVTGNVSLRNVYDLLCLSKRVNIQHTVDQICNKQKAICYFKFAGNVLGNSDLFYYRTNIFAWIFTKRHDLDLKSKTFYYFNQAVVFIVYRVIIVYTDLFIKSFYSKEIRHFLMHNFSDPGWYRRLYKEFMAFYRI